MAPTSRSCPPSSTPDSGRFRRTRYAAARKRYRRLGTEGQRPTVAVIGCSDSRSAPETVFDAGPGELFVIRNIAALVPVYEPDDRHHAASAALEYAVLALGVRHIVVLGHGRCGGIEAALDPSGPLSTTDFVGTWVRGVRDLAAELDRRDWPDPDAADGPWSSAPSSGRSPTSARSPGSEARERHGSLELHGAWFDIALGELAALTPTGWAPVA